MARRASIQVKGLTRLERALSVLEKDAQLRLNAGLREAGEIVVREAHALIRSKGLVGGPRSTGQLDARTRSSVSGRGRVVVRSGAMRRTGKGAPFNYPKVWEFGRAGQRAFLAPALERSRGAALAVIERNLDELEREFAR